MSLAEQDSSSAPTFRPYGPPGSFLDLCGPLEVAFRPGGEVVRLRAEARHANSAGFVSGGVSMLLLDVAMGVAVSASCGTESLCPSMQIDTQFVAAGKAGALLIASAEVLRVTSSVAFGRATLRADGQLIASATGVYRIPPAIAAEMADRRAATKSSSGESQ
jgi:uncharacterized protein (TIGR00369 family)